MQPFKKTHDKYLHKGYIIQDTRLPIDFSLTLIKGGIESVRNVSTRAETINAAEQLVRSVAEELVRSDGWDGYSLAMV
jgi:hypothetical protein